MKSAAPFLMLLSALTCLRAVEVPATIQRVIDGDTIEVALADGTVDKVRLLCVDTPEVEDNAHGKGSPAGLEAKKYLTGIAPPGKEIRLFDDTPALKRDKYGRLLAVVLMGPVGKVSAQAMLIAMGHSAYWIKYGEAPGRFKYDFAAAQDSAAGVKDHPLEQHPNSDPSLPQGQGQWRSAFDQILSVSQDAGGTVYGYPHYGVQPSQPVLAARSNYENLYDWMEPKWTYIIGSYRQPTATASISEPPNSSAPSSLPPLVPMVAENGDIRGADNDGDGRIETVFRKGTWVTNSKGTTFYRRGAFAAPPKKR